MKNFEKIEHETLDFDQHCLKYPSITVASGHGVYTQKCFIPYTHETTKVVYFVNGENGDSYGQYATLDEAIAQHEFIKSLPLAERRKYDV